MTGQPPKKIKNTWIEDQVRPLFHKSVVTIISSVFFSTWYLATSITEYKQSVDTKIDKAVDLARRDSARLDGHDVLLTRFGALYTPYKTQ